MNKFEQVATLDHSMSLVGGGPQVNKFQQVSSLDHQMSLEGGPMSGGRKGSMYSEVQCIMGNDPCGPPPEQTD